MTDRQTPPIIAKVCSYADIGNILVSASSKAIFIGGLTSLIFTGTFALPRLTLIKVVTDTSAAFVSYTIREYATKCIDDMQYVGGAVGGFLKYKIMGSNPVIGAVNNLGYEVCKFHNLNSNICALILEPGENVIKSLLGLHQIPIINAFFRGIAYSSILITNIEVVYLSLDPFIKTAFNFTIEETRNFEDNNEVDYKNLHNETICLLGVEQDFCINTEFN